MPVNTTHPDYQEALRRWELVRDAAAGEEAVKRRDLVLAGANVNSTNEIYKRTILMARRYLPEFDPPDDVRYAKYVQRAYFLGVTGRTRDALVGMVFRKPATFDLPENITALLENIDGGGQSMDQLAKAAAADVLEIGRYGLLTDFPASDPNRDAETEAQMMLRPIVVPYRAESIINWRTQTVGGQTKLSLVVLREEREEAKDEFDHSTETVYRVLRLTEDVYTQTLYNEAGEVLEDFTPRQFGGNTLDYIPFHLIGSQDNKPDIDDSPLYDLAVLNIAHYRNVADLEEAGFICGQPTLHIDIGETSAEFWKEMNPNGVIIGSRKGIVTEKGGKASLVQAEERSLLLKLKEGKEEEMIKIGARLIQRGAQAETAEAARINASAEASTLDMLVGNLSEALEACLEDCARFIGADPESIQYELNKDFWEAAIDPQTAMAIIQFGDAGIVAKSDQRHMIRSGRIGIADGRTDDEIEAEITESGAL